jgi:putative NIF3 family GTP cyclohydrolase 1 type 2
MVRAAVTVHLRDVVAFLDTELAIARFRDYGPNGLQVEGAPEVDTVVTGVSANQQLIDRAIELGADLIVVHHGLIWGGGLGAVTGPTARRLRALLAAGCRSACRGTGPRRCRATRRSPASPPASWAARPRPSSFPTVRRRCARSGCARGRRGDLVEAAAADGCDLFVTGELAERAGELARELQITLVAAGHYATEVSGPTRVADELRRQFPALSVHFVPVGSPL